MNEEAERFVTEQRELYKFLFDCLKERNDEPETQN